MNIELESMEYYRSSRITFIFAVISNYITSKQLNKPYVKFQYYNPIIYTKETDSLDSVSQSTNHRQGEYF